MCVSGGGGSAKWKEVGNPVALSGPTNGNVRLQSLRKKIHFYSRSMCCLV